MLTRKIDIKLLKINAQMFLVFLALNISISAQPGETCVLDYNPFEIKELGYSYGNMGLRARFSSELFKERINSQHIFIGKIVSQANEKGFKIEGFHEDYFKSIKVNVTKDIVGKLTPKTLELSYKAFCWQMKGVPEIGNEYIFFANEVSTEFFDGLVSTKWSAALNGIPNTELGNITKNIIDYQNGVKQPLVVGYLIKHKTNPYLDYVNKSFNNAVLWRSQVFKKDWRIKKLEYAPEYAEPLKDVKVIVKNLEGMEVAATKTDSNGRFEFEDLPKGGYVLYPDVPKTYLIVGKCYLNDVQKGGVSLRVTENRKVCDRTVRLDVAPAGKIEVNIQLEQGNRKDSTAPEIFLIGANSKTNEIYQDYSFKIPISTSEELDKRMSFIANQVITGEYVLKINTLMGKPVYYPGVSDIKKALIITIKEEEITKLDFSI